jgi:hypothetical protein
MNRLGMLIGATLTVVYICAMLKDAWSTLEYSNPQVEVDKIIRFETYVIICGHAPNLMLALSPLVRHPLSLDQDRKKKFAGAAEMIWSEYSGRS